MDLPIIAACGDSRPPHGAAAQPGDVCEVVAGALRQARALVEGLRSMHEDRSLLLGRVEQWAITALHGLVELSDEARYGQMPVWLRYARTWTGLARRELEQQIGNAELPGAIVLTGHLSLAIARALSSIEKAKDSLAEGPRPPEDAPW
jgi:hypothetical protein